MNTAALVGAALRALGRVHVQELTASRGIPVEELARSVPARLGLYVHVPFCARICGFCPYNRVLFERRLARRYERAVRRELELLRPHLAGRELTSLYIGGGTPTLLPGLVQELCAEARAMGLRGEIGVEVLPGHADARVLRRLRTAGVSFVSVGAQSFNDEVLRYLGRNHDAAAARRAVELALRAGFDCVDVDLVFDPVRFGGDVIRQDAAWLFDCGVGQVSTYPMMRFSYTRVGAARVHDEEQEKETLRCVEASGQARGYVRSSVWTFNRDPDLRYTSITREFYLGLGPSGSSFLDGRFTVNTFDADTYCDLVDRGLLPVVLSGGMDRRLASAYYLFWRLYEGRVDRPRFRSLFGVPVEQEFPWFVGALLIGGFLKRHGDSYRLTPAGLDLYHTLERWVTYRYIEPLWAACRASPFPSSLRL